MLSPFQHRFSPRIRPTAAAQGYTLPLVLVVGTAMLILSLTASLVLQADRNISTQRRQDASNLANAESGSERLLLELSRRHNAILLGRNYDPMNPATNRSYLGPDGQLNSGDESATPVDEWTGYNPSQSPCFQQANITAPQIPLTGNLPGGGSYTLRAYRYDPNQRQGVLLVEGTRPNRPATILALTIAVMVPDTNRFPGILATAPDPSNPLGIVALRGRVALGEMANIYYPPNILGNPSATGGAGPGDPNRDEFLESVWAGPADNVVRDTIQGSINACQIDTNLPYLPPAGAINVGDIKNNKTLGGSPNQITHYLVNEINLKRTRTLTVDTTQGPVYLYIDNEIELQDSSRILNVRTDGQPSRVGDLRIFMLNPDTGDRDKHSVVLEDTSCIQNAFLYAPGDDFELLTTGSGCPSGRNTNFEGVVWAERIVAARQSKLARAVRNPFGKLQKATEKVLPGVTSGIYVPSDISSLHDIFPYISWPVRYQFGGVRAWQQVRL